MTSTAEIVARAISVASAATASRDAMTYTGVSIFLEASGEDVNQPLHCRFDHTEQ
jgi:hypothetical protein